MALNWEEPDCFNVEYIMEINQAIRERFFLIHRNIHLSDKHKGQIPFYEDYINAFKALEFLIRLGCYIKQPEITEKQIWFNEIDRYDYYSYWLIKEKYRKPFVEADLNSIRKCIPQKGKLTYCFNQFLKQMYLFIQKLYCVDATGDNRADYPYVWISPYKIGKGDNYSNNYLNNFRWEKGVRGNCNYFDLAIQTQVPCVVRGILCYFNGFTRDKVYKDFKNNASPVETYDIDLDEILWRSRDYSKISNVKQQYDGFDNQDIEGFFKDFGVLKGCTVSESSIENYQFKHIAPRKYHVFDLAGSMKREWDEGPVHKKYWQVLKVPQIKEIEQSFSHIVYIAKGDDFWDVIPGSGFGNWINIVCFDSNFDGVKEQMRQWITDYNYRSYPYDEGKSYSVVWFEEKEYDVSLSCRLKLGNVGIKRFYKQCNSSGVYFIIDGNCKNAMLKAIDNNKLPSDIYVNWQSYSVFEEEKRLISNSSVSKINHACWLAYCYMDFYDSIKYCKPETRSKSQYDICVNLKDKFKTYELEI